MSGGASERQLADTAVLSLLFRLLAALMLSACGGEPEKAPTMGPTEPLPTAVPTPPAARTPRPGADSAPQGERTGNAALDAVIAAVSARDASALASLTRLSEMACTTAKGVGLPPSCEAYAGLPPEGTLVQAFPHRACEGEWAYDTLRLWETVLASAPRLFAVLKLDGPVTVEGMPGFPLVDHVILLETGAPSGLMGQAGAGVALEIGSGRLVSMAQTCGVGRRRT